MPRGSSIPPLSPAIEKDWLNETLVAAFKALLRRGPAGPGAKVAFVRLACSAAPALPLRIVFSRRLGDFFQGDIEASGKPFGRIHFGEWR